MEVRFECSKCGQHISATLEQAGLTAPCPGCGESVTVPSVILQQTPPPIAPLNIPNSTKGRKVNKVLLFSVLGFLGTVFIVMFYSGLSDRNFSSFNNDPPPDVIRDIPIFHIADGESAKITNHYTRQLGGETVYFFEIQVQTRCTRYMTLGGFVAFHKDENDKIHGDGGTFAIAKRGNRWSYLREYETWDSPTPGSW